MRSLIAQTHRDLELIAIDDGSNNGTFKTMLALRPELESRFARVEIRTKPNEGSAATLSQGLGCAKADLVYILDSDDVARPQAVEQLLSLMTEGVALAVGDNRSVDEAGQPTSVERAGVRYGSLLSSYTAHREDFSAERDFGSYSSLIGGNYVPNGWLLRRSMAERVGGFVSGDLLDDWSLLLRLAKQYRIAHTREVLAQYRVHDGNTTRTAHERILLDTVRILVRERRYCDEHQLTATWLNYARQVLRDLPARQITDSRFLSALLPEADSSLLEAFASVLRLLVDNVLNSQTAPSSGERLAPRPCAAPPEGSSGQRIHLYAMCHNDAAMLPFFFRH